MAEILGSEEDVAFVARYVIQKAERLLDTMTGVDISDEMRVRVKHDRRALYVAIGLGREVLYGEDVTAICD